MPNGQEKKETNAQETVSWIQIMSQTKGKFSWIFDLIWYWIFPVFMVVIGIFVPSLRFSVSTWPIPPSLYFWLFISTVFAVLWLIVGMNWTTNQTTVSSELKKATFISIVLAITMTAIGFYLLAGDHLAWYFVIPLITAIVDAIITADRSINNAAQKPIFQQGQ